MSEELSPYQEWLAHSTGEIEEPEVEEFPASQQGQEIQSGGSSSTDSKAVRESDSLPVKVFGDTALDGSSSS